MISFSKKTSTMSDLMVTFYNLAKFDPEKSNRKALKLFI